MKYAPDNMERCCKGADVRRSYTADFYLMHQGMTRSAPTNVRDVKYECAQCGKELHVKEPATT